MPSALWGKFRMYRRSRHGSRRGRKTTKCDGHHRRGAASFLILGLGPSVGVWTLNDVGDPCRAAKIFAWPLIGPSARRLSAARRVDQRALRPSRKEIVALVRDARAMTAVKQQ